MKNSHTLSGSVKSVKELSYLLKHESGAKVKGMRSRMEDDPLTHSGDYYSLFDEQGNILEHHDLYYNDKILKKTLFTIDAKNNTSETLTYDVNEKLESKLVSIYDDNENRIEDYFYDSKEALTLKSNYEFDSKGNCIKSSTIDPEKDEIFSQGVSEYDGLNNLIADKTFVCVNSELDIIGQSRYTYNDENKLSKKQEFDSLDTLTGETSYLYDAYGNAAEITVLDNGQTKNIRNEYEYDSCNNWVKRTISIKEGASEFVSLYVVEREISYFKK